MSEAYTGSVVDARGGKLKVWKVTDPELFKEAFAAAYYKKSARKVDSILERIAERFPLEDALPEKGVAVTFV